MSKAQILLVRHGKTALNSHDKNKDRVKGWADHPLDEEGLKCADECGDVLKKHGVTHVLTSPLQRGVKTAEAIAAKTGAQVGVTHKLMPWDVGHFQNKPYYSVAHFLKYFQENPEQPVPGGESYKAFHDRWRGALAEALDYAKQNPKHKVVLVTHSRNLSALDSAITGSTHAGNKIRGAHAPGSIHRLEVEAE
jgi:broad specificity phosphatase PhoE